jgi:hypothetical protein
VSRTVVPLWPDIDTVILNCPICNGPIGTTKHHAIAELDPLTIESPTACLYCRTFTFKVVEGKIMIPLGLRTSAACSQKLDPGAGS